MIVTIDTNVMIPLFSKGAKHREILSALIDGRLQIAISTSIFFEYEEVLRLKVGSATCQKILLLFELLSVSKTIIHIEPSFQFQVITVDPDDNKFSDCAITAAADYVITEDAHFEVLRNAGYKPKPITPDEFIQKHLM